MKADGEAAYGFEDYVLDPRRGCVMRGDRELELRPKAYALLRHLVENAGRLAPKEELMAAVWPSVTVSDESLARCLSDLRLALGDHDQRLIKTVRGRGVRFATPVWRPVEPRESIQAAQPPQPPLAVAPSFALERRQVAVMACEVAGLAALSEKLDPEELREVTAICHLRLRRAIEGQGGFVAYFSSDGALAYFGYPTTGEHDAERAVRAALTLVDSVGALPPRADVSLRVRVGVATGAVVISPPIDPGAPGGRAVIGEPPNLARRLGASASPGVVLIDATTRQLAGGLFDYAELGETHLDGLDKPVEAWRVLGASAVASRFRARLPTMSPMIGREEELDLLRRRWAMAKAGDGQVALISGDAGIGKSRLAETLIDEVGGEPHALLRCFCSPHHQDNALHPSLAPLERAAGIRPSDNVGERLDKLEALYAGAPGNPNQSIPLVAALLSIPVPDRYPTIDLNPYQRRQKTLEALLAPIEALAATQPMLILYEDAHWCDPTTKELLDMMVDRLPSLRALLVVTLRPEFNPRWIGRPHVTLIGPRRLTPCQSVEMIAGIAGDVALADGLAERITQRADGVPLFLEELTKAVIEGGEVTPHDIPTSLQASLLARLDRLPSTREVVRVASAMGRRFTHELILAVADSPAAQVDAALAQLVEAELIYRRGEPPEAEYRFKHALVRDAAYGALPHAQRGWLHARIVEALESKFPELVANQPARLAQHCVEAGLTDKAADYRLKAGSQAMARSALTEAETHFRAGLSLLATLLGNVERRELELALLSGLMRVLSSRLGFIAPEVMEVQQAARRLYDLLGQPPRFHAVLASQYENSLVRGDLAGAHEVATEALERGLRRGDRRGVYAGHIMSAATCLFRGEFAAVCGHAADSLRLYSANDATLNADMPEANYGRTLLGGHLFVAQHHLGLLDQARRGRREALADVASRPFGVPHAVLLALAARIEPDPEETLRYADEMLAGCMAHGLPFQATLAIVIRGGALSRLGRHQEGLALQLQGVTGFRAAPRSLSLPAILIDLASSHGLAGRPAEGLACLDEAAGRMDDTGERWSEASLHRTRGELLVSVGDTAAATDSFRQSIVVAHRQEARFLELLATVGLCRLLARQGKRNVAGDLLGPVLGAFTEGFDAPEVKDAAALLETLS